MTTVYGVYKGTELIFQSYDYDRVKWVAHGYNHYYCGHGHPDSYTVKIVKNENNKTVA